MKDGNERRDNGWNTVSVDDTVCCSWVSIRPAHAVLMLTHAR